MGTLTGTAGWRVGGTASQGTKVNTWFQEQDHGRDSGLENLHPQEVTKSTVPDTHKVFNKLIY